MKKPRSYAFNLPFNCRFVGKRSTMYESSIPCILFLLAIFVLCSFLISIGF